MTQEIEQHEQKQILDIIVNICNQYFDYYNNIALPYMVNYVFHNCTIHSEIIARQKKRRKEK